MTVVSLEMSDEPLIFQELIKVYLGTFLLEDGPYNTLQKYSAYKDFIAECRRKSSVLFQ